ncbi:hypothetical protein [Numidum massiliense]|uniref:hypothetical protein n=1 Tax=Numidum massiliense TaxID=1522315 RepID=UPI0006D52F33|nr:hypothetical protein [Numidum massiliense]
MEESKDHARRPESQVTRAKVVVMRHEQNGFGVGVELLREGEVYRVLSLWIDDEQITSTRQVLHFACKRVMDAVDDDTKLIIFVAQNRHFLKARELSAAMKLHKPDIDAVFYRAKTLQGDAWALAQDACERQTNIISDV